MAEIPQSASTTAGARLDQLVEIMRILRSPDGCPWDREQTLLSLRSFILEEAYELLEAIDRGDIAGVCEELGDLVFETVFLAQVCTENRHFTIADSLEAVANKLIRRHPHVFGNRDKHRHITTSEQVKRRWEEIKAAERTAAGKSPSLLESIPTALPSLLRAYRMGKRAATVGFDWPHFEDVLSKVDEELNELRTALTDEPKDKAEEELGDLLFAIANLARHLHIEPDMALRQANRKFSKRFAALETYFLDRHVLLKDVSTEDMERAWANIKQTGDP